MRRKIIKQGASTLTFSLPASWARKVNIKAGEEIEILERGHQLVLSPEKEGGATWGMKEPIDSDISAISNLSKRILESHYIQGCQELRLKVGSRDQARAVQTRAQALQGLEVVEQGKEFLLLRDVAGPQAVDIEPLVRRMFHILKTMGHEGLEALKAKDTDLEYIEEMEGSLNRLWDLTARAINIQGRESTAKATSLYTLCFLLEEIGDELKDALHFIGEQKAPLTKDTLHILGSIFKLLHDLEDLTWSFSIPKADRMAGNYDLLLLSIKGRIGSRPSEEAVILMHAKNMMDSIIKGMNQVLVLRG